MLQAVAVVALVPFVHAAEAVAVEGVIVGGDA